MCGGVKQRGKKKKEKKETCIWMKKKYNGKNKIKNNKKLKLRNVIIKF